MEREISAYALFWQHVCIVGEQRYSAATIQIRLPQRRVTDNHDYQAISSERNKESTIFIL